MPRRYTQLRPEEYRPYRPGPDLVPEMVKAGEGYRIHITGLTHDERGYPAITVEAQQKLVRLAAAYGEYVYLWDLHPNAPPLARSRVATGFGPARSLAVVPFEGTPALACGTTRGVVLIDRENGTSIRTFALPGEGRHGVNDVAFGRDAEGAPSRWGTHSQVGVYRWAIDGGEGVQVVKRPARGVAFDGEGSAVFGVGNAVVRLVGTTEEELRLEGEVTCVVPAGSAVAVGTASGVLYLLEPRAEPGDVGRASEPVMSVCAVLREGDPLLLVARREQRIAVRDSAGNDRGAFIAPRPVRWLSAAEAVVAGATGSGRVCLWTWDHPERVHCEVSVPGSVRALAVWEED